MIREQLTGDKLSFAFLLTALGMLIVFAFIRDPARYTISLIGTEHPALFFVTSAFMSIATASNMLRLLESSGLKRGFTTAVTYIANAAMIMTSVTMTQEYVRGLTEFHWITAFMFMGINPLLIFFCAVKRIRTGNARCIRAMTVFLPIYLFDILYMLRSFALFGMMDSKNGIMEIVPIITTFILLFLFNHTRVLED